MFGLFRKRTEDGSASVDVGALYAQFFAFGASAYNWQVSPAVLASTLSVPDGMGALLTESRRLSRVEPRLIAYKRCMTGAVLTGEPERPSFPEGVPERIAEAAAALWMRSCDPERERELLLRVIVDGELLILDDGQVVPADGYEPVLTGPDWAPRVVGYWIGKSPSSRSSGLMYLGDRRDGDARAVPWVGPALPFAAALLNIRIAAGHGLGALAKVAAVIANVSPDRITASPAGRSGVVSGGDRDNTAGTGPITSTGVGSVPYLRNGEQVARIAAGPDAQAMNYESVLERDEAAALNLPLSELVSDYSSGSFSNLRMAWQDADREYSRRRKWWHRHYRLPMWREVLSMAFADGRLPRMTRDTMVMLRNPAWAGPKREPPQPEKEASALKALVDAGILTAAQAALKLET